MCDEWMTPVQIPMTAEQFQRLPRNPAHRYRYFQGQAWISPQARFFHGLLDLKALETKPRDGENQGCQIRPLTPENWDQLPALFVGAFANKEPFGSLDPKTLLQAALNCLEQTRYGGDGPLIESACQVAFLPDQTVPVGACLITLLPLGDPADPLNYSWREEPPPDAVAKHFGRPHLTWIFVDPNIGYKGIGTSLLLTAAQRLRQEGYTELASTFLLGNVESMLWHWRNQFRLVSPT